MLEDPAPAAPLPSPAAPLVVPMMDTPSDSAPEDSPRPPKLRSLKWWLAALVLYWGGLFIGTHIPLDTPQVGGHAVDKYLHFAAYFGLTVVLLGFLRSIRHGLRWKHLGIALAVLVVYAVIDERTQPYVNRVCDLEDFFADAAGVVTALALYAVTHFFAWRRRAIEVPDKV